MPKFYLLALSLVLASLSGNYVQAGGPDLPPGNHPTPSLTWEQFKDSCLHPQQFNSQIGPRDIRIQCTDVTREFVGTSPGQVALPGNRRVIFAVFSDKYHVNASQAEDPITNRTGSCMRFKEVERTVTIEKKLSCDDVLGIKSDLADYCASTLSITKGANPKLIDTRETGRFIDTCGGNGAGIVDPGKGKPN